MKDRKKLFRHINNKDMVDGFAVIILIFVFIVTTKALINQLTNNTLIWSMFCVTVFIIALIITNKKIQ